MYKPLSLRKNFLWTLSGNLTVSVCKWGMLMVLTKMLPVTEVGIYMLALAITTPGIMLSMLQLRTVHVTDVRSQYPFSDYLGVRLLSNMVALLIIAGILIGLAGRYACSVYVIILLTGFSKAIEAVSDIAQGVPQRSDRMDMVSRSLVIRSFGSIMLFALSIKITGSLAWGMTVITIWSLAVLLAVDRRNVERFETFVPRFRLKTLLPIVRVGLPLGVVMGIISVNSNTPRYFVETYLGIENLGYFGAMAYIIVGASQVAQSLGGSITASLSRRYCANRGSYVVLLGKATAATVILSVLVVVFAACFGKPFLSLVYKPEYAQRQDVFVWLMAASGMSMITSILGFGVTAVRYFKSQVPIFLIALGACLFLSGVLVPRYGMKGAAWALLLTSVVQGAGCLLLIMLALKAPLAATPEKSADGRT